MGLAYEAIQCRSIEVIHLCRDLKQKRSIRKSISTHRDGRPVRKYICQVHLPLGIYQTG